MKVVHISTSLTGGGAAIAAFRLHQSLMKKEGVHSSLLQRFPVEENFAKLNNIETAHTDRNLVTRIRKKYNIHTEHYHWVELSKHPKEYEIATFATTSYRLDKLPIIKDADIIHLHWVAEFLDYPTFFKNIKQPIVWTLHDINPLRGLFHFDFDKEKNKNNFGKIDEEVFDTKIKSINKKENISVVCLSDWMKRKSMVSPTLGRYPHYIIPNGLNFSMYPQIGRIAVRKNIGIDNDLKTVLVVGSSLENEQKGFPLLFDAINSLNRSDLNFISIGRLSDPSIVRKDINHIHIDRVEDTSELNKYYAAADITVIPSKEDNLPNVMLESFANGTPIMSFSNGGMTEHMADGANGIMINETSSEALAISLTSFLENKYTFDRAEIRNYALENFLDAVQVDKYLELYNQLLIQ